MIEHIHHTVLSTQSYPAKFNVLIAKKWRVEIIPPLSLQYFEVAPKVEERTDG